MTLWPNLNPLLILHYEVCVEVSLLCSLSTMVCMIVSNVVYQVALLPSYTGSLQYCVLGYSAPFLQQWFEVLSVRSLCSLPTTVRSQAVRKSLLVYIVDYDTAYDNSE